MRASILCLLIGAAVPWHCATALAGEQPVAIFHAFNQKYPDVERFVCDLGGQGYSHLQIAPAQQSNPEPSWWARYQPLNYARIEGMGTEQELKSLIDKAHGCNVKVIADVVFNHMANMENDPALRSLNFDQFVPDDFHTPCSIDYSNGSADDEINCWLGRSASSRGLPDLKPTAKVKEVHKAHLAKLLSLGIDGFRFDAAKHIPLDAMKDYIDYVDRESRGGTWNYQEVIEDHDTSAYRYNWIAAVTDFVLYNAMKNAFSFGGDLRNLAVPDAVNDSRSVTFGENHDTIRYLNPQFAINPYNDRTDSYLASAYVLARENGTPLVFNEDNLNAPYLRYGVQFRKIMRERGAQGRNVHENVLKVADSSTVMVMERGPEGFLALNKGAGRFNVDTLDMTLTNIEGCYRELRNNFTMAVERRGDKKFVTKWGNWNRGGMELQGRDALYFVREPWEQCR